MTHPLSRIIDWLQNGTARLLGAAGVVILGWGLLAPVGTVVWWLNQSTDNLGWKRSPSRIPPDFASETEPAPINCYIVFFTGVGDYSVDQLTSGEEYFLDRLEAWRSNCVTVRDVFPYSAANKDLAGDRWLAPLWRAAEQSDGWFREANLVIKIRNLWRFAIAADERYSEIYSQGIADAIVTQMDDTYPLAKASERSTVILIGTSGGVQVALAAVPYLQEWLDSQLIVISAGGTFDGEAGFNQADQVYHLQGRRDWIEDLSQWAFPSRWPWAIASPLNRARRQGRYHGLQSGPHAHDGAEGYFGEAIEPSSQRPYVELTLQQVQQIPIWPEPPSSQPVTPSSNLSPTGPSIHPLRAGHWQSPSTPDSH